MKNRKAKKVKPAPMKPWTGWATRGYGKKSPPISIKPDGSLTLYMGNWTPEGIAANECMKIFGSYGYSTEYPAERFYRDAKSLQIVEGTSNVQKIIIAGMALGTTPNRE